MKESKPDSGAEAPELLVFEKDKAGQRIYDCKTARLPEYASIMTLDRLIALAAEFGTPHFRIGRTHYAYIPYSGVVIARDDEAAAKPAEYHRNSLLRAQPLIHRDRDAAGVKAAPSIEVRA